MTAKRMRRTFAPCSVIVIGARRRAGLSSRTAPNFDVIPDGPQGRAGTSSRTARSAEPGSRRAPRKCRWIPAFAGMTAKRMWRSFAPWSVIVVGARRRAGLPSRAAPNFDVIPDGPQGRAGIQTGAPQVPLDPRFRGDDSKKNAAHPCPLQRRRGRCAAPGRGPEAPPRRGLLHLAMTSGLLQCSTGCGVRMRGVGATKVRRIRSRHR